MALRTLARIGTSTEGTAVPTDVTLSLANHIRGCYDRAKTAKQLITERLLACERQRKGEYDPVKLAQIKEAGGSEVFLMLTDIKCRAADAWIKDVMLNTGERPYAVAPTEEPDLPTEIHDHIVEGVTQEAMMAQQQGMQITPEMVQQRLESVYEEIQKRLSDAADIATSRMNKRIHDKMQEARFDDVLSDTIYDFVTFPASVIKGPFMQRKLSMKWGHNWTPIVTEEIAMSAERVSPYDIFPSPSATSCDDGPFCHRHRFFVQDLSKMIGTPGYNDGEIRKAISMYGKSGLREMTYGETEREWLAGRRTSYQSGEIIEGIEFWGSVQGDMLQEWGMQGVDAHTAYEINGILIGTCVIKAVLNPNPLGKRPYSKACFEDVPGAFWGIALPEMMRDVQTMCNTSARALANNMGVASGPQVEVSVDRLPDGEDLTAMHPWKIWQSTTDKTGGGQPAIRFFQPDMNAQVLLEVLQYFSRIADEVTGVPNYIYGSNQSSGAGRTASGLSMLMENASKGIKQAIITLGKGIGEIAERMYYHLMVYDPDNEIKGDMKVVPAGVVGALIKDHINEKRQQFLQATSNPADLQILGMTGRAELLRQIAEGMQLDLDGVMPDKQTLQAKEAQGQIDPKQFQAMQQQLQELGQKLAVAQQQIAGKEMEAQAKKYDSDSRVKIAEINSQALVDSRTHENELRAATERDARLQSDKIHTESAERIAQIAADSKIEAAVIAANSQKEMAAVKEEQRMADAEQRRIEQERAAKSKEESDNARRESDAKHQQLLQTLSQPKEPPVHNIHVNIDAKQPTKKSITVKRDANGNMVGAEVGD